MTLNTQVYILDEIDPHQVFKFCNSMMGVEQPIFTESHDEWETNPVISLDNAPGQGFPAWIMSNYRKRGFLHPMPEYARDEEGEASLESPACYMEIRFDTTHAYRDEYGGSTELHARYLVALNDWLQTRNVSMCWKNHFDDSIHHGVNGLESLFEGGDRTTAWFDEFVLPLVKNLSVETF